MLQVIRGCINLIALCLALQVQAQEQDTPGYIRWINWIAEERNAEGQYCLGLVYAGGLEVTQNDVEAAKWFQKAAEQGHPNAQYNLGVMYAKGRGVAQNQTEAEKWLQKSKQGNRFFTDAEQENDVTQCLYLLGTMHDKSKKNRPLPIYPDNDAWAEKWYRKAAERGDAKAQYSLGVVLANLNGAQSYAEVMAWFRKAAEQGDAEAHYMLGRMSDRLQATGCSRWLQMIDAFAPKTDGPFRLDMLHCLNFSRDPHSFEPPTISPDGKKYFVYGIHRGLWYGSVDSKEPPQHLEIDLTFLEMGGRHASTLPFRWAADSQSIFGARQDTGPGGFALGPMSTITIPVEGPVQPLPTLEHAAGNLDGLLWVGGNGLALAKFGTGGRYYRPELPNHNPTIAIVDGLHGKVLQATPLPNWIGRIDARIDPHGRIYTIFAPLGSDQWFEWHQGSALRAISINLRIGGKFFSITPDLKSVLIVHGLSATGWICENFGGDSKPCPPPTPVSGTIADLRDIATGQILWSITGTATYFSDNQKPAISPDGRYALVMLPPDKERSETIAVISLRDGRILQLLISGLTGCALGFSEDGQTAWISKSPTIVTYRLR